METKANYVIVGIFTLIVLIAAIVIVFFISRYGEVNNLRPLDIRIPGSVTGLGESSQVLFNGIRVGSVRKLELDKTNPNMVIAKTEIAGDTPITRSTQATLGFQGLTGIAFVELTGGALDEPNLFVSAEEDGAVARLDADPSTLNNLLATAQDIFARADSALKNLEGFIQEAREPLTRTVENSEKFSDMLASNNGKVNQIVDDAQVLMTRLRTASEGVNSLMSKLDALLSPDDKNSVVAQLQGTLQSISNASDTVNQTLKPIARNMEALFDDARRSVKRIERAVSDVERDPQRLIFGGSGTVPQYDGRTRR